VAVKKLLVAFALAGTPGCATPTPAQLAPAMVASTVALSDSEGEVLCSGVAISPTQVMTAAHCLSGPAVHVFDEADSTVRAATVVWSNVPRDVAVLEVTGANFTPAHFGDSATVQRGDRVFTVGNSYGDLLFSFTVGYVSYVGRTLPASIGAAGKFIQYSTEARPGNSGGPVFNEAGEVIAILVRGDNSGGIIFAVPINEAKPA